jgi:histone deacetylase complex regulatory component SIN3
VISPRWDQQQPQECLALPSRNDATVADALRFLLSVKQEFTSELYKYDEFMQIMGEFSHGRLVTVIAFYLLASQLADC